MRRKEGVRDGLLEDSGRRPEGRRRRGERHLARSLHDAPAVRPEGREQGGCGCHQGRPRRRHRCAGRRPVPGRRRQRGSRGLRRDGRDLEVRRLGRQRRPRIRRAQGQPLQPLHQDDLGDLHAGSLGPGRHRSAEGVPRRGRHLRLARRDHEHLHRAQRAVRRLHQLPAARPGDLGRALLQGRRVHLARDRRRPALSEHHGPGRRPRADLLRHPLHDGQLRLERHPDHRDRLAAVARGEVPLREAPLGRAPLRHPDDRRAHRCAPRVRGDRPDLRHHQRLGLHRHRLAVRHRAVARRRRHGWSVAGLRDLRSALGPRAAVPVRVPGDRSDPAHRARVRRGHRSGRRRPRRLDPRPQQEPQVAGRPRHPLRLPRRCHRARDLRHQPAPQDPVRVRHRRRCRRWRDHVDGRRVLAELRGPLGPRPAGAARQRQHGHAGARPGRGDHHPARAGPRLRLQGAQGGRRDRRREQRRRGAQPPRRHRRRPLRGSGCGLRRRQPGSGRRDPPDERRAVRTVRRHGRRRLPDRTRDRPASRRRCRGAHPHRHRHREARGRALRPQGLERPDGQGGRPARRVRPRRDRGRGLRPHHAGHRHQPRPLPRGRHPRPRARSRTAMRCSSPSPSSRPSPPSDHPGGDAGMRHPRIPARSSSHEDTKEST